MRRILFVDDEPRLLDGLQRMLRQQRKEWDMSFASSGPDALALLETKPIDVVVTDMRMPGMDGAQLLELVRERFPAVIRIVLSGYVEQDAAMRALSVAHQFLSKPCDPEELRKAIDRSCGLADNLLADETIRRVVGLIGNLPARPRTSLLLQEAMQQPDIALEALGRIIEQDVGITAKILQLVNSAFFGLQREVTSVRSAVGFLGIEALHHLVLTAEIFRTFQPAQSIAGFSIDYVEEHSQLAAQVAVRLPAPKAISSAGVIAAVLHDAGKLVLATHLPEKFGGALKASREQCTPLHVTEKELVGADHAEIGAYLLGVWGLPETIVHAVARHHHPEVNPGDGPGLTVLAIAHIADALAYESPGGPPETPRPNLLDLDYMNQLGVASEIPAWQKMAAELRQLHVGG